MNNSSVPYDHKNLRGNGNRARLATSLACAMVVSAFAAASLAQPPGGAPPIPVVVARVQQREVVTGHTFVGTVTPTRVSDVGSAVDGRVVEYPIRTGNRVKKGQTLAQLLTGLLEIELRGAEAELRLREAALEELRRARPEEIEQAKARLAGKLAARDYAIGRYDRFRKMPDKRAFTDDQIEEISSAAVQAQQAWIDARIAFELAEKGARKESIDQAEAKVAVQQEEINRIRDQLGKHTIKAPFDGYVIAENSEVGQWVSRGGLIARVAELDQADIQIQVLEDYVPKMRVGDEAQVEITSLAGERFVGRVAEIVPQADLRTRNFPVKIRIENRLQDNQPVIKGGMIGRATVPVGKVQAAILIPKDAIVLGGASPMVVVVDSTDGGKSGKARHVPIELGVAWNGWIQAKGQVKPNDLVVVQGNERIMPQQSVAILRVQEAASEKSAKTASNDAQR